MGTIRRHNLRKGQPLFLQGEAPDFFAYVDSNPTPTLITNVAGDIQYVNAAWQRLTGYSWQEVVGKNPRFLRSDRTPPGLHREMLAHLARGESFVSSELVDKRKDGSEFSLYSVFFPVQLLKNTTYFAQVLHDISRDKQIEKQKDSFIKIASHELRNPLSTISLSLDLLKHDLGTAPPAVEETFGALSTAMDRFKSLFSYLLDMNKIHTEALKLRWERKNLPDLIEKTVREIRLTTPSHTLIVESACSHPFAMFDEERIGQVLTNLISNAVKYSPGADRVVIRLLEDGRVLKVSVQDFGIGIPKAEQEKIFEMHYRAENRGDVQGTGLGLYISAQILAAHDAHLSVESEEGKGSTFSFSLPFVE